MAITSTVFDVTHNMHLWCGISEKLYL